VSHGALGHDFFSEFSERDSTVLVSIHFLDDLGGLLLGDVETAGLDKTLELVTGDGSGIVLVKRVESLIDVEVGLSLKTLAGGLSLGLASEVSSPDGLEVGGGGSAEAVVTSVDGVTMVGATTLGHGGVVSIKGEEGIRELAGVKATVTGGIVSSDEEVELLGGREDTDGGETLTELDGADHTVVVSVEHLEGVGKVKVGLSGELGLLSLDVVLDTDHITKSIDELILVTESENRFAGWAGVAAGLRGHANGRSVRR